MKTVRLKDIFFAFLKIGAFAFGGVYSMLAFYERKFVRKRRWLSEETFSEAVAIGQLTPGAPIINTGIFIGFQLRRFPGAILTIIGQVLPSLLLVICLGFLYIKYREFALIKTFLKGIGASVVGLLLNVVFQLSKKVLNDFTGVLIGSLVFILAILKLNSIALILISGLCGAFIYRGRK